MNTIQKLVEYFEQQLSLQRKSEIKYTGEEAYFDAIDVCKNALKSLSTPEQSAAQMKGDGKTDVFNMIANVIRPEYPQEMSDADKMKYLGFNERELRNHRIMNSDIISPDKAIDIAERYAHQLLLEKWSHPSPPSAVQDGKEGNEIYVTNGRINIKHRCDAPFININSI